MGTINYEGRAVETATRPMKFGKGGNMTVLEFTIAEQHREQNKRAAAKYQQADKKPDDWIPTTTSWHRLTIFGDKAEALAANPDFGHGAVIDVQGASYTEEAEWQTRDGVMRAGRPETIGDRAGSAEVKVLDDGRVLGRKDEARIIWDGVSEIPPLPRGNGSANFEINPDEGF